MENRLKIIRTELGLTQERLAELAGVSRYTVNKIEGGSTPDGKTISKIVKATGQPANKIFFDLDVV